MKRTCRKIRYFDKLDAQIALASVHHASTRGQKKNRDGLTAYFCRYCKGWHLGRR